MSTLFYINENLNIGLHSGASYCILEETRRLFDYSHRVCLHEIYEGYDVGMGGVTFEELNQDCYNYFVQKCEIALKGFPYSEHAKDMEPSLIAGIEERWQSLLELLKQDPRYQQN